MSNKLIPEIMYEEGEEGSSNIPFIMVPPEETMPHLIYMFESRQTGEEEPGLDGNPVPIVEWDLHQYADLLVLKNNLDVKTYDIVRLALGLDPIVEAVEKGKVISQKIKNNLETK